MAAIHLSDLRLNGISLGAREGVSVVHQVCRLKCAHAQRGEEFQAPTLAELLITETGEVVIDRLPRSATKPTPTLTGLIEELLPQDSFDDTYAPPVDPRTVHDAPAEGAGGSTNTAAGDPDRLVLQGLFERVHGLVDGDPRPRIAPLAETTSSGAWPFFDPSKIDPHLEFETLDLTDQPAVLEPGGATLAEWDAGHKRRVEHAGSAFVPRHPKLHLHEVKRHRQDVPVESRVEPVTVAATVSTVAATRAPRRRARTWERRAVLWGLAVNVTLGLVILRRTGHLPDVNQIDGWIDPVRSVAAAWLEEAQALPAVPEPRISVSRAPSLAAETQSPAAQPASPPTGAPGADVSQIEIDAPLRATHPLTAPPARRAIAIQLSRIHSAGHAVLSPDGRLVAFDMDRDGERGVFIANRASSDVTLASGEGRAASPSWSPDMRWLAFVRAEPGRPSVWNLWIYDVASGALQRLTDHQSGIVRGASWFPDATRICYGHDTRLMVLHLESRRTQELTPPAAGRSVREPVVSPDGRSVAFEVEGDGIWLLDTAQGLMERVIEDPAPSELTWANGSGELIYYSLRLGQWRAWTRDSKG
jgi:hypothetical protein